MDRGEIEIEEVQKEDDWTEKPGWAATGAAILRRGWWLGKRVAIAGAAITSAPVVIPPLIVLSTLGLALSFPFGIYFAGYACADKIMSTLLPLPPSKQQLESEDSGEMGIDAFQGEKPMDEIAREAEESEKGEILEGGSQIEIELGSRSGKERALVQVGIEEENEVVDFKPVEKVGEKKEAVEEETVKGVKVRSDTASEAGELRKSDDASSAQGVEKGVGQGRGVQETASESTGAPKSPYTVAVMSPTEGNIRENEPPNLSSEHLSIVELRGKEKANDNLEQVEANEGLKVQMDEGGREEGKRSSSANGVVTEDQGLSEGRRSLVEPLLLNSYVLPTEAVSSKKADAENFELVGSTEHRDLAKPEPGTVVAVVGMTGVVDSDDEIPSEEELWDQLLAIRTIVGYKATLHSSLWEELRALYLLTGVEPPVSLKEAADHAEISKNLQFLKAVVGVK